jgi:hypothetical protein
MTWALRICIAIAGIGGYLFHHALGVHSTVEGLKKIDAQFFSNAFSDPLLVWFAAPYIVLAFGLVCRTNSALCVVLVAMAAVALIDASMYSKPNQDRGWYVVLSPILLLIPAIIGLVLAIFVNKVTWSEPPARAVKKEASDEIWKIDA